MTGRYVCEACKYDGGWHYAENGDAFRCPNRAATEQATRAREIATEAHASAFQAAKRIISDAAHALPILDANTLRDQFEAGGIDTPVIGSAFSWAAKKGLIEAAGFVKSGKENTHGHRVFRWRSLVWRGAA